jgi:hypothetical protein
MAPASACWKGPARADFAAPKLTIVQDPRKKLLFRLDRAVAAGVSCGCVRVVRSAAQVTEEEKER